MNDPVVYGLEPDLDAETFQEVLVESGLEPRRPAEDLERLAPMLRGSALIVTARLGGRLVGIARSPISPPAPISRPSRSPAIAGASGSAAG